MFAALTAKTRISLGIDKDPKIDQEQQVLATFGIERQQIPMSGGFMSIISNLKSDSPLYNNKELCKTLHQQILNLSTALKAKDTNPQRVADCTDELSATLQNMNLSGGHHTTLDNITGLLTQRGVLFHSDGVSDHAKFLVEALKKFSC